MALAVIFIFVLGRDERSACGHSHNKTKDHGEEFPFVKQQVSHSVPSFD
jgi:hypothetical protein